MPKGVDEETRENLEQICAAAIEDDEFEVFMINSGITVAYLDSEAFEAFLKQNYEEAEDALRAADLRQILQCRTGFSLCDIGQRQEIRKIHL